MHDQSQERLQAMRRLATRLTARADLLPEQERALVRALIEHGHSLCALSRLFGDWPSTIKRRLDRVMARVASPKFGFVAERLARLSPVRQRVARSCVLHGLSLRAAARELRLSHHSVRRHAEALHAMFEAADRRLER
jgi:hypothetical protein